MILLSSSLGLQTEETPTAESSLWSRITTSLYRKVQSKSHMLHFCMTKTHYLKRGHSTDCVLLLYYPLT